MTLSTNRLIRVNLTINPLAAASRGFGTLLVLGDSNVIPAAERYRMFTNVNDVAQLFGVESEEYKAAAAYYAQDPAPINLMIGRWIRSSLPATLKGGKLSPEETAVESWKEITNGTLQYTVNGESHKIEGINLGSQNSMKEVAQTVTSSLSNAVVTWETDHFETATTATGSGQSIGYFEALPPQISVQDILALTLAKGAKKVDGTQPEEATHGTLTSGVIDFEAVKAIGDGCFSITIDSNEPTVVAGLDFRKMTSLEEVAADLSEKIEGATCSVSDGKLLITSDTTGTSSVVNYAVAAPVTKVDLAAKLKLTKEFAYKPAHGFDPESPVKAVATMCDLTADWYGVSFASKDLPADNELIEVAAFIEAQTDTTRVLGITTSDERTLSADYVEDIASKCKERAFNRTVVQYSQQPYAVCSFFGRAFTVNFNGNMTTITMMYKREPGIVPEDLTETQAQVLAKKRCNVFAKYNNNTAIIQNGVMSGDYWWDERHGADWLKEYVQNNLWNFIYTSKTKVGQDDAGMNSVISVINDSLAQARANGFIGAGVWNNDGFGQLERGDYMPSGFYVYTPPMATQTQADRDARISTPIQVAAKLLGAIHTFDVSITLNR